MEMPVHCEVSTGQNSVAPRLVFDRAFIPEGDLPENQDIRDEVIRKLNYAVTYDPTAVLEDLAWLDDQLESGEPIVQRSFIHIKEKREDNGWAAQRQYIGLIRDVLSITNNGSQFAFGETPAQSDEGWQIVLSKGKEIDQTGASAIQTRVHDTNMILRRAKLHKETPEVELAFWDQQHTIAKQQRAVLRLRSLALIARGPQPETAVEAEAPAAAPEAVPAQQAGRIRRLGALVGGTLTSFSFTL